MFERGIIDKKFYLFNSKKESLEMDVFRGLSNQPVD